MIGKFICAEASCRRYDMAVDEDVARALDYKCPTCHAPLAEQESGLSPLEEQIIGTYPSLIAIPFARLQEKKEVESRQRLLMETTTNLFKYLALVVETEYLTGDHVLPELTSIIEGKLSAHIPLSAWPMFLASAIPALQDKKHEFFVPELPGYFRRMDEFKGNRPSSSDRVAHYDQGYWNEDGDFVEQNEKTGRFNALISYRNKWAHKPNLPEAQAKAEFEHYYQVLLDCLEAMAWCENYPLYKHEGGQAYRLMGTSLVSNELHPVPNSVEGNLYLGHPGDQSPLQLVPLFIVPRDYLPESGADLFFYDAYTGKRIVYVSPKGHSEYIEGTVGRWRELIQSKRVLWPRLGKGDLTPAEISRRSQEVTGHSRNDLLQIGKVIKGLYYSRKEIEANLMGWPGSMPPLLALRSAAGGGKTCMMDHVAGQWKGEGLPVLFIRAQGLEQADLLKLIQDRLRLKGEVTFSDLAGALDQPLLILIDGLNEHAHPKDFLGSILAQAKQAKEGAFKCFFTVRSENLDWVELDEEQKQLFQAEASTEGVLTKEEDDKLPGPLLTPLDRLEVEAMWQEYGAKNPKKFKPRFSFEKAQQAKGTNVDAMEWMSRPLLLRLFLEVYHERDCPSVIGRYPLFADYLKQLGQKTKDENAFLLNVGRVCLEEETIVLDLDTLYTDLRTQKVMNDSVHYSPFRKLIREGVLVELREGETRRIGFGVEALAEHVLGEVLLTDGAADTPQRLAEVLEDKDFPQIKRAVQVALQAKVEQEGRAYLFEFIDAPVEGVGWAAGGVLGQLILETGEASSIANDLMANPTLEDLGAACAASKYLEKELAYQPAVDFLERVAELAEEPFADTEELAYCFSKLAGAFKTTGDYDQALEFYQKALAIWLQQLGPDHDHVAFSYNEIGLVYDSKGEYDRGLEYFQKALTIWLQQLGPDHDHVALSYGNIGGVHDSKGEYDRALEFYRKSLEIILKTKGADHPHVACTYNNIGLAYDNKGEYDRSTEYHQKSLTITLQQLGPDHPDVAMSYNNIGLVHGKKGSYDQALEFFHKALAIWLKRLGPNHPYVAFSYNNIGTAYDYKGEYDRATEYHQKSLAIKLKQLGPDHPDVALSYNNIGLVHSNKGEYDRGLEYFQKALTIWLQQLGPDHDHVALSYSNIGIAHRAKGALAQAREYFEKSLAIYEGRGDEAETQELREQIANLESKPATE